MPKDWSIKKTEKNPQEVFSEALRKDYSFIILKILLERGLDTDEKIRAFFDFDYDRDILDPLSFSDMEKAVERISRSKETGERIAIFGDYDADGVTATALLFEALLDLGFEKPLCYIPERQSEGYGLNGEALAFLKKEGASLIITVDCGISNAEEVRTAKDLGMEVIITDHHQIPDKLPEALAIINPHLPGCGYGFPDLSGVGVAFKLAMALYQKQEPGKIDQLKWALDLVGIGTVADCVPLVGENRILVRYGLVVLSKTRRAGIKELFQVGRINISENDPADTHKVAFQISPRINAAGRMDHANAAFNLILEKDRVRARTLALELEDKNKERQKITEEIVREVSTLAENSFRDKKHIVAVNPHWSVGLLGLSAGKIAEKYQKPTFLGQEKESGEIVGSFRSIPELNIMEVLRECQDLFLKFGGHAQAAGVSLRKENLEDFYKRFSQSVEKRLEGVNISKKIEADAEIRAEEIDWELVEDIEKMAPFGEGNREPVFILRGVLVEDVKIVGNGSKHLKLWLRGADSPKIFESIGFGMGEYWSDLAKNDKIDIVFSLSSDEWNGNKKIQLKLIDIKND
ncbi:MAG: single-stranded-DNA-specific exonuclease RecJ [Patescibacteria group bacterium]